MRGNPCPKTKKMTDHTFQQEVRLYIEENGLLAPSGGVLVALSGGADSVALLRVLSSLGYPCEAVHCNFRLRGEESERDELFVRGLCASLGIRLHVEAFDTRTHARTRGISIEMAARELRYALFSQLCSTRGLQAVAVAHHREDSVETMLLNLVRGTGIKGLTGIAPRNGNVVRPLLSTSRTEIEAYLHFLGQEYVTDSSNWEDDYTRNKIRLHVLPQLRAINPSADQSIAEAAARLGEVEKVYRQAIREACLRVMPQDDCICIAALLKEPSPAAVLFELLHPLGFNSARQADILRSLHDKVSGRRFFAGKWELLRDRDYLYLRQCGEEIPPPFLVWEEMECPQGFSVPPVKDAAWVDADKATTPPLLRKWQADDRFVPFGMKGFKRVNHYMRDRKYSLFAKENQYVVTSGGEIMWLVGERVDNRFRITPSTRRMWVLKVIKRAKEDL